MKKKNIQQKAIQYASAQEKQYWYSSTTWTGNFHTIGRLTEGLAQWHYHDYTYIPTKEQNTFFCWTTPTISNVNYATLGYLLAATGLIIWLKLDFCHLFFSLCGLEIWWMTLKSNRAPLLSNIKLWASFHHHIQIQTGVTVRKRINWILISVTLTSDLWPCFCMDITSAIGDNSQKFHDDTMTGTLRKRCNRRTDVQTYGRTGRSFLKAAWSQLKI